MTSVNDVIAAMHEIAPPAFALEGDPVGLHSGAKAGSVSRLLLSLDASIEAVGEAEKKKAEMLVVHHPRFYRGLKTLSLDDAAGCRALRITQKHLAIFSAHTNLDITPGGTNDCLAKAAGLGETTVLQPTYTEKLFKIAVFVPTSHVEKVLRAMTDAGAGAIGKYSECSFRTRGTGTFRCGENTRPFQGRPGSREEADEYRLETIAGEFILDQVIAAMLATHPYEEAAYDLYPLANPGMVFGLGRVGDLPDAARLDELAARLVAASGSRMAQYSGKLSSRPRRVAVWAGAAVNVEAVLASGAQALVTGELGYHDLETLMDRGVSVITLGHGASERLVLAPLARALRTRLGGVAVEVCGKGGITMRNI